MKNTKIGVLSLVASSGGKGIQFEDEVGTWYNPLKEVKDQVLPEMKGKLVEIILDEDERYFSSIVVLNPDEQFKKIDAVLSSSLPKKEEAEVKPATQKEGIPSKYIILLKGKEFITHRGLLFMAHEKGLYSVETELVQIKEDGTGTVIFKATVTMAVLEDQERMYRRFTGFGDANEQNVNDMVAPHKIRMAETRAINRALRLATNIGMCSAEELGGK